MPKPIEIAVLGSKSFPAIAGADRVAENILLHLPPDPRLHFTLYIVRTPAQPRPFEPSPHLRVIPIPALKGKHSRATSYFLLSALHCALRLRPALVHAHDSAFGPFACILRLFHPHTPILGTFHGNPYERAKWSRFAKAWLRFSERAFIAACTSLTTVARAKVACVRARAKTPITFIPNGVDPSPPIPATRLLPSLSLKPQAYLMFAAGRMDPTKGLHHLLDAYERLAPPLPLLVVGGFEGHNRAYSQQILARCQKNPRILLLPRLLAKPELFELLAHARLFIFPSEIEAMSMMLLEAISCGVPVLASNIPENIEVTGPDYPWLFQNASPHDLQAKLAALLAHNPATDAHALSTRVARHFHWPAIARRYLDLYTSLLHTPQHPAKKFPGPPDGVLASPT